MAHEIKERIAHVDDIGEGYSRYWLTDQEIIRCCDCKHFKFSKSGSLACTRIVVVYDSDGYREERHLCLLVNPDGFCSWAERDDQ